MIGGNDVLGTMEGYIYQLTITLAAYPGATAGPWTSATWRRSG